MATQRGTAVIYGVNGLVFAGGIASATNLAYQQSQTMTRDSGKVEVVNANGDVVAQVFHSRRKTLNVQVIPYHATAVVNAKTSAGAWNIAAGTSVTVTNAVAGTWMDDVYNVVSSSAQLSTTGAAVVDLVLEAFEDTEVHAEIT